MSSLPKTFALLLVLLCALCSAGLHADPFNMDSTEQKLEIVFSSPAAAQKASLVPAPEAGDFGHVEIKQGTRLEFGPKESFRNLMAGRIQAELKEGHPVQDCWISAGPAGEEPENLRRAGFYKASAEPFKALEGFGFLKSDGMDLDARAARRYQALYSSIQVQVSGSSLFATIERPDPLDLGASLPLSFSIRGTKPSEVIRVRCKNASPRRLKDLSGSYCFALPQGKGKAAPQFFGPGLGLWAVLTSSPAGLRLRLRNDSKEEIEEIRVIFRVEAPVEPGVIKHWAGSLDPGVGNEIEVPLKDAENACATAQIDARRGGKLWRDYRGCGAEH
jgi:hypothetical protein